MKCSAFFKKIAMRMVLLEKMLNDRVNALSCATVEYRIATCELHLCYSRNTTSLMRTVDVFSENVFLRSYWLDIFSKGSGSHVHVCPRPLCEHLSTDQAFHPSTCMTTAVVCALMPPYRSAAGTCVIARKRGCFHRLARAAVRCSLLDGWVTAAPYPPPSCLSRP